MLSQIIIPVINSGGGPSDHIAYLAMLIFINVITISIFLGRSIWWILKRPKSRYSYQKSDISFYKYCIGNELDLITINTWIFLIINGLALFIVGTWWIYHLLGGTMPL